MNLLRMIMVGLLTLCGWLFAPLVRAVCPIRLWLPLSRVRMFERGFKAVQLRGLATALLLALLTSTSWIGVRVNLCAPTPVVWVQAQAQAQYASDTFVDTAGTALQSHTPTPSNTGGWSKVTTGGMLISPSGHVRQNAATTFSIYATTVSSTNADYYCETDWLIDSVPSSTLLGPMTRCDTTVANGTAYWLSYVGGGQYTAFRRVTTISPANTTSTAICSSASTFTPVVNHTYRMRLTTTGSNPVVVSASVIDLGTVATPTNTLLFSMSGNDTDATRLTAQGKAAFASYDANSTDTAGVHCVGFRAGNATPVLAANGNIILQSVTNAAITLNVPYTGGTSPFTFVWQRAPISGSTIGSYTTLSNGSGISGATTATLVDASSLTPGARYAYKATVSDSASASFTTFSRLVQLGQPAIKLESFGDSTTVGWGGGVGDLTTSSIAYAAQFLQDFNGLRNVSYVAAGVPGTYTSDWTSTAPGSNFANALAAAGGSFSGYYVFVRLGVNNAQAGRSAANFLSEMTTIVNNVVANGGIVLLDYPMWREPGLFAENGTSPFDEGTTSYLLSYLPQLDSLVNNTTVFAGDKLSFDMTMSNPQLYFNYVARPYTSYPGGIHPSNIGTQVMGYHEGNALLKILNLLGTTGILNKGIHPGGKL